MRRARRTRVGTNRNTVVDRLKFLLHRDEIAMNALATGDKKKAFGRLINKWLDNQTRESVIDRYVDEEARDMTMYAINIVSKELSEAND